MEENRTPEETEAKRKQLEQKRTNHRFRNMLPKFMLIGSGLFTTTSSVNAQSFHLERISTTQQQAPRQAIYGSPEWAESQGYKLNRALSYGLNTRGKIDRHGGIEHHGYLGVWQNPYDPQDCKILPQRPDLDKVIDASPALIRTWKNANNGRGAGPYERHNIRILPRGWELIP